MLLSYFNIFGVDFFRVGRGDVFLLDSRPCPECPALCTRAQGDLVVAHTPTHPAHHGVSPDDPTRGPARLVGVRSA